MHAASGIQHLRFVACRNSVAAAAAANVGGATHSCRSLAHCCAIAAACRQRRRPGSSALFHTSRPLFAPTDLPSSVSTCESADSPESNVELPQEAAGSLPGCETDYGHQYSQNATVKESPSKALRVGSHNSKANTGESATVAAELSSNSTSTTATVSTHGRKSWATSLSQPSTVSTTTPMSTALVKTDTITLASPSTGALSIISTITAIPTRTISLASDARPSTFAPEAIAVARGLLVSGQSNLHHGKPGAAVRQVWLVEEGKRLCDSVQQAERDIFLDRPDCTSRVLAFASVYGETKQALVVHPMELVMWVADILRPTDPGIDEYLNLILFPDLEHHTFSTADDLCWSSSSRPSSEFSPSSSPARGGRSSAATRSLAQRHVENDRRLSNVRAVLDRGARLLSHQLATSSSGPSSSVLILDHAGVFNGSPQGHTFFDALEASLKHNLLPSHASLRVVYNVTAPSYWNFEVYEDMLLEDMDQLPNVMWHRSAPDALTLRLDPDVHSRHDRLVLPVFRAWWQAQYIEMRLRRVGGLSAVTRQLMVDTLRPVLGNEMLGTEQLDLLALAMIGLDAEARLSSSTPLTETIEECARRLLGRSATREAREETLKHMLESEREAAKKDKERGPGSPNAATGESPSMHSSHSLPFVKPDSISVTLDDVVGLAEAKQALDALITLPMKHPEQFSSGVLSLTSASGVLLYGPPGTGKTMLAKAVAKSAGAAFIAMNPSDVQDKFVGESEKIIKRLFEAARTKAPCVIFLDEVDALFSKRDFDMQGYRRDVLNEFCMQWDGIKSSKNVIVLGATNRPFDLDEAVLRRFSRRVLVDLPSSAEKRQLLVNLLKEEMLESSDLIDTFLVPKLVHHSASDIKNVAISAAMAAVRELPAGPRVLGQRHFEVALKEIRPSVTNSMDAVVKLREFASSMEGDGNGVKRLGFAAREIGKDTIGLGSGDEGRIRELRLPRGE